MLKVVVKRSKWLRGKLVKDHNSYLLHPISKRMCCLGFLARVVGYKPCEIRGIHTPAFAKNSYLFPNTIVFDYDNTMLCDRMMSINDDDELTDKEREAQLKPLFKQANIGIKFVG